MPSPADPADQLVDVANEYKGQGLATVAISANSVKTHPQVLVHRVHTAQKRPLRNCVHLTQPCHGVQDGPDKMADFARHRSLPFPYLYDESQDVAR